MPGVLAIARPIAGENLERERGNILNVSGISSSLCQILCRIDEYVKYGLDAGHQFRNVSIHEHARSSMEIVVVSRWF